MDFLSVVMLAILSFTYLGPLLVIVLFLLYLTASKDASEESAKKRKTKRILGVATLTALILWISSLIWLIDAFSVKPSTGPKSSPSDLWVANELDLSFVGFDEEKGYPAGRIVWNGEVIEVMMDWGKGSQFNIGWYQNGFYYTIVWGTCKFSEDEGTVYVSKDLEGILNGVKTITFVRHDNPNYHGDAPDTGPDDPNSP